MIWDCFETSGELTILFTIFRIAFELFYLKGNLIVINQENHSDYENMSCRNIEALIN